MIYSSGSGTGLRILRSLNKLTRHAVVLYFRLLTPEHAQSEQEISSKIFNDHEHTQNSTESDSRYGRHAVGVRGSESESVSDVRNKFSTGEGLRDSVFSGAASI